MHLTCSKEFELYDLATDPAEIKNLADKKKYEEVLVKMKTKLKDFQQRTSDPWIIMWDHDSELQDNKSTH